MAIETKIPKSTSAVRSTTSKTRTSNLLEASRKEEEAKKIVRKKPSLDVSTDSSSSSGSSKAGYGSRSADRSVKVAPEPVKPLVLPPLGKRRCAWITAKSEEVYVAFHDEEWGFPVHDDRKLFELLIFSEALAELSWPTILNKRNEFQMFFADFEASSVAEFTEKRIISLKSNGTALLSEQKLRAVVENARQILKVKEEFGSFSRYCWNFVSHKAIANGYRYARQVPVKIPKAEVMSKDMMRRGFRCIGPTVIYSFMQAAGLINDHLITCFRYEECMHLHKSEIQSRIVNPSQISQAFDKKCLL